MKWRLLLCSLAWATSALAQSATVPESVTVTPGPEYHAGGVTRFLVGNGYRDLWTTPIRVPVLDMDHFAGGLTPLKTGSSGGQTWSLHVRGGDGEEYVLRSVDKHVKLGPEVSSGVPAWLLRDQISAGMATGALIVAPLLRAAHVPHEDPLLVVLPDNPRLGEYRKQFAGLLVWVEHRPRTDDTSKVAKTEKMALEISTKATERLDSRGYLAARLMDMYVGDWDRGHLQWFWQRTGEKHDHVWRAIPHDRDWAFANHDGLLYYFIRQTTPWFVEYKPKFPKLIGLEANVWGQDRRLLQDLDEATWDSVGNFLKSALTDSVITDAVNQLPPPERARYGDQLIAALRGRRDQLPWVASSYYHTIAKDADVHMVATPSIIEIKRSGDALEIRARTRDDGTVYYDRHFDNATKEIRLYADGGPDSIVVTGQGGMLVRLVAGSDGDVVVDQGAGGLQVFDGGHRVRVLAGSPETNHAHWTAPTLPSGTPEADRQPVSFLLRDAGAACTPTNPTTFSSTTGISLETGQQCDVFGFRRVPFALENMFNVGYNIGPGGVVGDYTLTYRSIGGSPIWRFHVEGTSSEYTWFYGFGNETPHPLADNDYRARESRLTIAPSVAIEPVPGLTLSVAPEMRYRDAENTLPRFFALTKPYGSGPFGIVDGYFSAAYDSRHQSYSDTSGLLFELSGHGVPSAWDAVSAYGTAHAEVAGFTSIPSTPLWINLRAGGDKTWGAAPYQDLAHVGGQSTVRGFFPGRYAGDAALYQQSELLITLGQITIVAPATVGLLGLNDIGRVFAAGQSSSRWHDGYGGGVWGSFLSRRYIVKFTVAHGDETVFYAGFGLGW
ncbi:MAG TPA: hypothetical protein VFA43_08955 [Gemmatimonadaceae bacterium]|nr:hypothetical protein [Gemmatimonadaceae bacterium]